jgi:uncharacterized membrane protein YgcG
MFLRLALLFLSLIFLGNPLADTPLLARSLVHESFHADIRVYPNGELEVTETIRTRFEGSWNGLYRFIPVEYVTPQGFSYKLRLDLESITDELMNPLRYETTSERHYRKFTVWIPGAQDATRTIVIRYRVGFGLRFLDDYDELYWNVTGDEGLVPIEQASARIQLPAEVTGTRGVAFTGAYGSVEQAAEVQVAAETVTVQATRALNIREGLTVSVAWDTGIIPRPGGGEKVFFFISNNWIFVVPLLVFCFMYWHWHTRGRDPRQRAIAPQYEPPKGLTPAEVGTLMDNTPDLRDITATLVDLAVRGYLLIEETETDTWFGLSSKTDYTFVLRKKKAEWEGLSPHEEKFLESLFSYGIGDKVDLADLQNEFYQDLPAMHDRIFEELVGHKFYAARPDKVKNRYLLAALIPFGLIFLFKFLPVHVWLGQTDFGLAFALGLSSFFVGFFGWFMHARTPLGARTQERILGFEEFIRRVESDRFKRMIEGPEQFEKLLPFAMAMGVEGKWAAAFEDIYKEPPDWYRGSNSGRFHTRSFVSDLSRMSSQTGATLGSSPRSSGGSGSGGGGSSGGGFGGGGTGGF